MGVGSKLSPKLRKALSKTPGETIVRSLVEIAPGTDEEALSRALTSPAPRFGPGRRRRTCLTSDIPVNRLSALDSMSGIVYVEADERYRR